MIDILTLKGERYSYNEDTQMIFKDGKLLPSTDCEPIFSALSDDSEPKFAGILLKKTNQILSLSGKINKITENNSVK